MKKAAILLMLMACTTLLHGQETHEWEKYYYQLNDVEDIEMSSWQTTYETLCALEESPININTATKEDLEQLPFLTDIEIEDILAYAYNYGPLKTIGELAMVESLDGVKRNLLQCFIRFDEVEGRRFPGIKNILEYGQHDILLTAKAPLYNRKGDDGKYLGDKFKHNIRYSFGYGQYLKIGLVGAKDSGEPFFKGDNKTGYDYYSLYMIIRKMGRLKTLAAGRYRVNFGMGLVINNDFALGKTAALASMGRTGNNIRAHSSKSDYNYLQGAAATIALAPWLDISTFASYRKIDATLTEDKKAIATILQSSYHRTETEMAKKHNAAQNTFGGNVRVSANGFHGGVTMVHTSLDKPLKPNTKQIYRQHYAAGDNFLNVSADYGYIGHKISFSGETATGNCNAWATINKLSYQPCDVLDIMALQRFYSYRYTSLYAQSFSEGGMVQNESGIYVGANWRATPSLSLTAYTDFAYFAWPKYQAAASSQSTDNMIQAIYTKDKWAFTMRYRLKMRECDNEGKTALIYKTEHRARASAAYNGGRWHAKLQTDLSHCKYKEESTGWMATLNMGYQDNKRLSVFGNIAYFDTDSYDSRVYAYEHGMLYDFSFPAFYGNGIRYSLMAKATLGSKITISAKAGTTNYFDRDHIGSGYQEIAHSSMTDIEMQVKCKF